MPIHLCGFSPSTYVSLAISRDDMVSSVLRGGVFIVRETGKEAGNYLNKISVTFSKLMYTESNS